MSSISSLSRAVSGLMANQTALNATAHNLTNVNTPGYTRQQVLMRDANYLNVGFNETTIFQLGLGTDVQEIRQVRDRFLDMAFREENSRFGFYESQATAIEEIENILGEIEGESFSQILNDLWVSLNELSKHPEGLEARGSFVQNAVLFVEKSNLIANQLEEYQTNLNTEIGDKVARVNEIGHRIDQLNNIIVQEEGGGGNANDYRDERNSLIDELSYIVDISYKEDGLGNVTVSVENVPFVTIGHVNDMGTTQAEDFSTLVDPYWPHLSEAGPPPVYQKVYNLENPIGPQYDNNKGELKGLILSRGTRRADYTDLVSPTWEDEIEESAIMTVQAQFDNLVHGIVTMINDTVAPLTGGPPPAPRFENPNGPFGLDGSYGVEIFTREYMDRYDGTGQYNEEDPSNEYSLYSAGNLKINEAVLLDYNKICIGTEPGFDGDNTVVQSIIDSWQVPFSTLEPGATGTLNINEYYNAFVSNIGNMGNSVNNQMGNQEVLTTQIDNQRLQLTGVSSDEELGNLMKYQHAYNASARVVTVVDEMIQRIIDQLGA